MNEPKVSIIIPVYNVEKYLQRCIDSLIAQTYENIEMIFVDDGSADGSYQILEKAAREDERIRVFSQKNAGPSAARNLGLDHCTGKYVMFCDSDDTVEPDWVQRMAEAIVEHEDSWIVCEMQLRNEAAVLIGRYLHHGECELDKKEYFTVFCEGLSGFVYNKIFNQNVIRGISLRFDETRRQGEDVVFCLEYLKACSSIFVVKKPLYSYYKYESTERLTNRYHRWDFWTSRDLYRIRKPYIAEKDKEAFQNWYWKVLSNELDRTMLFCNDLTVFGRIELNRKCVRSAEYQELLKIYGRAEMNAAAYACLRAGWYDGYWLIQQLYKLKESMKRKAK